MILLAFYDDGERRIRVVELQHDGSRVYVEGDALYTHIEQDGRNRLAYVEVMRRILAEAPRVLVLGTAGGALPTALSRDLIEVTALDNLEWAFAAARRWFHLPAQVECVHADAVDFLRTTRRRWAGIAVDVFRGMDIPEHFLTHEIGGLLLSALEPGGAIAWNVPDGPSSFTVGRVTWAMKRAGLATDIIPVADDEWSNTVVVGRAAGWNPNLTPAA